jgi:hypothetical protein
VLLTNEPPNQRNYQHHRPPDELSVLLARRTVTWRLIYPIPPKRVFHFDDDDGHTVFKRFKAFQQTERSSTKTEISMIDFLHFCRIPLDDHHTCSIIKEHRLHHWTVFIDLAHEDLKELGFSRGPILLFRRGVDRLIHGKHEFDP